MYKYVGASLSGLFIFMMFPSGIQTDTQEGLQLYGSATIDYKDEAGNSMFTQTVHNQLFDAGEAEILKQVFADGTTATVDNVQIASMCIAEGTVLTTESNTATQFRSANTIDDAKTNCIEANFTINADETADSPANVFTGGTHTAADDVISSIGICSGENGGSPHALCSGILFAVVDTSDVTLGSGETVTITYTFDISSAST